MGARENLQRLADKKQQEITSLETELQHARIYLQAIQDSIRALPREVNGGGGSSERVSIRPGTKLAKAREAILAAGRALHINDLLKALGLPDDKAARVSLSGSIAWYVRKGQVFTRPAPNTFGLLELEGTDVTPVTDTEDNSAPELPKNFGA